MQEFSINNNKRLKINNKKINKVLSVKALGAITRLGEKKANLLWLFLHAGPSFTGVFLTPQCFENSETPQNSLLKFKS